MNMMTDVARGRETDELTRTISVHRRTVVTCEQRAESTRRKAWDEISDLEATRRKLEEIFAADMKRIETNIAGIRERARTEIAKAEKLASASRRALEELAS